MPWSHISCGTRDADDALGPLPIHAFASSDIACHFP
jgi:hypothetical protein